jgi:hypothetical protein
LAYPEPTLFSPASAHSLEALVRGGGREYVEFAQRDGGQPLLGIKTAPDVRRALHQRLVVTGELSPISGLQAGDILEERNSACLVPTKLPEGARTLLSHGTVIGTYRVEVNQPEYVVTVALGQPRDLVAVSGRDGAGPGRRYVALPTPVNARYIRLGLIKRRVSPVTDFLFAGETEVIEEP